MTEAFKIASENTKNRRHGDKKFKDKRATLAPLKIDGRVLVRNLSERGGPGKLRSFWEHKIYIIKERKDDDGLVYAIVEENNPRGKLGILHRNNLLACDEFPVFGNFTERDRPNKNHNKHQRYAQQHQQSEKLALEKESSYESENELIEKIQEIGLREGTINLITSLSTKERSEQKIRQDHENQSRKTEDKTATSRKHISKQSQLIKTIRIEDPENICTKNAQEPQVRQRIQEKPYIRKIIEIENGRTSITIVHQIH